jgi:hypothetical protein
MMDVADVPCQTIASKILDVKESDNLKRLALAYGKFGSGPHRTADP